MREGVRSGRRANYYTTENSFIDHYAKRAGLVAFAVYHVLERYANSETQSTFVKTATVARLLDIHVRSVQRAIKTLEALGLIRITRDETQTTYYVMPVPTPQRVGTIPLFEAISEPQGQPSDSTGVPATGSSPSATLGSLETTSSSRVYDTSDAPNKEEQNLFNKTPTKENKSINSTLRMSNIRQEDAVSEQFMSALPSARRIVLELALPPTAGNLTKVAAAVAAEVSLTGRNEGEVAGFLIAQAMRDRSRGIHIDGFYFEGAKWRHGKGPNVRSKAEQRKFDNLEVNERVKQRFKERFGNS